MLPFDLSFESNTNDLKEGNEILDDLESWVKKNSYKDFG